MSLSRLRIVELCIAAMAVIGSLMLWNCTRDIALDAERWRHPELSCGIVVGSLANGGRSSPEVK